MQFSDAAMRVNQSADSRALSSFEDDGGGRAPRMRKQTQLFCLNIKRIVIGAR